MYEHYIALGRSKSKWP